MRVRRFRYQEPDCALTLRDAMDEYLSGHPGLLRDSTTSETGRFFHAHDACHVLFGLDTTLIDEGLADLWTLFGSDMSVKRYVTYFMTDPAARNIIRDVGFFPMIATTVRVVPLFLRIVVRSRRMPQKWHWGGEERYLDWRLCDLRHEFNIQIL